MEETKEQVVETVKKETSGLLKKVALVGGTLAASAASFVGGWILRGKKDAKDAETTEPEVVEAPEEK